MTPSVGGLQNGYKSRLGRLQEVMTREGVDVLLLSVGPDLPYLIGYEAVASERLTMLIVHSDADPQLVIPELEAPRIEAEYLDVLSWVELDDPIRMVADACKGAQVAGLGDHTWSVFMMRLQDHLDGVKWQPASTYTASLRMIKDEHEVEALRAAAHGVDRVLARVPGAVRFGGRTELDVARDLKRMAEEEGHDDADFAIVASGPNGASPHHDPGRRVIQGGETVVCDFGGRVDGYHSDVTRTFVVGEPTSEMAEVHSVVLEANRAGRAAVRPGAACQQIDRAARQVITGAGYGDYFIHRTGHGIGLEVHEHPYMVEGNEQVLQPGMAFSIEPGIYLPGRFGVRIEDIAVCDPSGIDELNRAPRELVSVD